MSIFKRGTLKVEAHAPVEVKPSCRLAIIVGHSKADGGANGYFPTGKIQEYDFHNKEIVPVMLAEAAKLGLEAKVFLRDGTDRLGVGRNVSAWADLKTVAIELHFNSTTGAKGSETLYDSGPMINEKFAQIVQDAMVKVLGRSGTPGKKGATNRGIKLTDEGRGAHNLTSVLCVGCLVEPAFCDNKDEAKLLWDNREAYAKILVQAAKQFFDS
jgi:N-acetylmuramoyl-L-alanine amidase